METVVVVVAAGSTPGAVRVAHPEARRASEGRASDGALDGRLVPAATSEAALEALTTFLRALAPGDAAAALAQLAPDVVRRSDGGGVYSAAKVPVHGAGKVVELLLHVASAAGPESRWAIRSLDGAPTPGPDAGPRWSPSSFWTPRRAAPRASSSV